MNSAIFKFYTFILSFILFISVFFVPIIYNNSIWINNTNFTNIYSINDFSWPIPGYTSISSPFGKRVSPTSGASSYHSGIDIPAPEGTNLCAIDNGIVTFASWGAGGGYTITYQLISYPNIKVSYCHVSPIMYVTLNEEISKGEIIGTVGPKNVYGIINNPYKDSNGNPTNGASTGCHLHFTVKVDNNAVNPLDYYRFE